MAQGLGDFTVATVAEELGYISAIVELTGLTQRSVKVRCGKVRGNMLVRNAFAEHWPSGADRLRGLTVAFARDFGLVRELSEATKLTERTVSGRLAKKPGKMLVGNAFTELEPAVDEDDEDDDSDEREVYPAEPRDFSATETIDLLGAVHVSWLRRSPGMLNWVAERVKGERPRLRRLIKGLHGRSFLRNVLAKEWPIDIGDDAVEMLGGLRAGVVSEAPVLLAWVARELGQEPERVRQAVEGAEEDVLIRNLLTPPERTVVTTESDRRPTVVNLTQGAVVAGRYRILRRLGQGAFSTVYEVQDMTHPAAPAAVLKYAPPGDAAERLGKEIEIAQSLQHENITVYRTDEELPDGARFAIMAYGGTSLEARICEARFIDTVEAIDVVTQLAGALDHAHSRRVIHQDLKPANVLVQMDGGRQRVRLTDFGVSVVGERTQRVGGESTVIGTSVIGLTPAYAAPEQMFGFGPRKASDQYSLALVLCSMLEGRIFGDRFERRDFTRLTASQNVALWRALDPDPERRFHACSEFADALKGTE